MMRGGEKRETMLSIIVAMDKNNVIGRSKQNDMPWHLPNDLQHFKRKTTGHTIIMGRKTFESLGRVLPNRTHVVLTRTHYDAPDGVIVMHDINELLQFVKNNETEEEEFFVIGGGNLFTQLLPYIDRMYITHIDESFVGDVTFPTFDETEWKKVSCEKGVKDDKNPYDYYFLTYERI